MKKCIILLLLNFVSGVLVSKNTIDIVKVCTNDEILNIAYETIDSITHDNPSNVTIYCDNSDYSFSIENIDSICFLKKRNYLCVIDSVDLYWNRLIYENDSNYACVKYYNKHSTYAIGYFNNQEIAISVDSAQNIISVSTEDKHAVIDYYVDTIVINMYVSNVLHSDTILITSISPSSKKNVVFESVDTDLTTYLINYFADYNFPGLSNLVGYLRATDDMTHYEKLDYIVDMYDNWDTYLAEYLSGKNPTGLSIPQDVWKKIKDQLLEKMPNCVTGECIMATENTALIQCTYNNVPRGAICGVVASSDNQIIRSICSSFAECKISFTGLTPATTYNYWAYIEIDGETINGETRHFTTNLPDISGTWTCKEEYYTSAGEQKYNTYTITLYPDGSASCSEYESIVGGSWAFSNKGLVTVSIMIIATQSTNSGVEWSGNVNNIQEPTKITGSTYRWNYNQVGYFQGSPKNMVLTK